MFIVLLKFAENKDKVGNFLEGHKDWLQRGFDEGVFLLAGSLQPGLGGALLANAVSRPDLEARVKDDPFVAEKVVTTEILEFTPAKAEERLKFLL